MNICRVYRIGLKQKEKGKVEILFPSGNMMTCPEIVILHSNDLPKAYLQYGESMKQRRFTKSGMIGRNPRAGARKNGILEMKITLSNLVNILLQKLLVEFHRFYRMFHQIF